MGRVSLLCGTTKGLFVLHGAEGWRVEGPLCGGMGINHALAEGETIWAAGGGGWHPASVWRRRGGVWTQSSAGFAPEVTSVWSLARDGQRLLAGTKPAALYESRDEGETWSLLPALTSVPGAEGWEPGAAGLTLHTILSDGKGGLWVGISAAGVFHSADGGASWAPRNRRSNRPGPAGRLAAAGHYGASETEVFSCVHNMMFGASPGLIYMQNHLGVYRTRDGGEIWEEITEGLPSTFGFPVAAHRHDPGMVWTFPLNGDSAGRFAPEASAAVWRSADGGETWQAQRDGLPGRDCFFTVLRQAMAVDHHRQAGLYFGTNSGSVFASEDEGQHWAEVARHLPTVLCVEIA